VLAEAGESIERFVDQGLAELGPKLGPLFWQFAPTKKFDADDFGAFLGLLPKAVDGLALRHAVEVRHDYIDRGGAGVGAVAAEARGPAILGDPVEAHPAEVLRAAKSEFRRNGGGRGRSRRGRRAGAPGATGGSRRDSYPQDDRWAAAGGRAALPARSRSRRSSGSSSGSRPPRTRQAQGAGSLGRATRAPRARRACTGRWRRSGGRDTRAARPRLRRRIPRDRAPAVGRGRAAPSCARRRPR
jgi:hypothetical protein